VSLALFFDVTVPLTRIVVNRRSLVDRGLFLPPRGRGKYSVAGWPSRRKNGSKGFAEMTWKRVVLEIGMGTDIRGANYTTAAVRALRDALWHNSLSIAKALGQDTDSMRVEVTIGVPQPDKVDKAAVLAVLPHGTGTVNVVQGGLEIPNDEGTDSTLIAHAAAVVRLDLP
jgi:uncharacterized protein (TIGR02058 family)